MAILRLLFYYVTNILTFQKYKFNALSFVKLYFRKIFCRKNRLEGGIFEIIQFRDRFYSFIPFCSSNALALSTLSTPVLFFIGANSCSRTTSKGKQLSISRTMSRMSVSNL